MNQEEINLIRLNAYDQAINKIDDYFEYGHDSDTDKKYVMKVLDNLARELSSKIKVI